MKPFGVMLSPLTNREAVLSSRFERTQATVDDVLEYEAGMEFEGTKVELCRVLEPGSHSKPE
jgi:Fic/DOC family N-terminal